MTPLQTISVSLMDPHTMQADNESLESAGASDQYNDSLPMPHEVPQRPVASQKRETQPRGYPMGETVSPSSYARIYEHHQSVSPQQRATNASNGLAAATSTVSTSRKRPNVRSVTPLSHKRGPSARGTTTSSHNTPLRRKKSRNHRVQQRVNGSASSSSNGVLYSSHRQQTPTAQFSLSSSVDSLSTLSSTTQRSGAPSHTSSLRERNSSSSSRRSASTKRPRSAPHRKRSLGTPTSQRRRPLSSTGKKSSRGTPTTSSGVLTRKNAVNAFKGEITVMTRFRPLLFPQVDPHPTQVDISYQKTDDGTTVCLNERKIHLHKDMVCLKQGTSQKELYDQYVKRQVKNFATAGTTGCVLLYGKTGSGKTFTAGVGEGQLVTQESSSQEERKQNRGVISRALKDVFSQLEQEHGPLESESNLSSSTTNSSTTDADFRIAQDSDYMVHLCMVEVYGKEIYDMLSQHRESKKRKLECQAYGSLFYACYADEKQDPLNSRVRYHVKSYKDAMKLIRKGIKRREVSEHKENKHSSRSHCLMFIHVTKNSKVMTPHSTSTFVVADLCGAELIKKTASDARQTSDINSSLTFLKDILIIMSKKRTNISFEIKFRYHPLCKLLKCCMVSSFHPTIISLIVCCTSAERDLSETVSSLKFANMASQIKISSIQAKTTATQAMYDKKALETELNALRYQLNVKVEKIHRLQDELSKAKHLTASGSTQGRDAANNEIDESELRKEIKKLKDLKEQINELHHVKQQLDFEIEEYKKLQQENQKMHRERKQLIQQQKLSDLHSQNLKQVIEAFCDSMQEIMTLTKSDSNSADNLVEQLLEDLHSCLQPAVVESRDGVASSAATTEEKELQKVLSAIRQLPQNLRLFKSKYQKILKTSLTSTLQKQKDKFKDILKQVQAKHDEIVQRVQSEMDKERHSHNQEIEKHQTREEQLQRKIKLLEQQLDKQRLTNEELRASLAEKEELLGTYVGAVEDESAFALSDDDQLNDTR
eukprot:CAMPEP_0117434892 /NCGR_PEP_ID=MMETSP0759-20121206/188_1 /TAXON_ID=63605 /ORGANISM="Percolomonas cosmopolitus, Strain WS" /LENGTH=991 /DNA_ID=CAMNT_0005226399 /DNA_START=155 /DNA_END=3127 /DNA_ORIENTATION=-